MMVLLLLVLLAALVGWESLEYCDDAVPIKSR